MLPMLKPILRKVSISGAIAAAFLWPLATVPYAHAFGCSAGAPGATQVVATQTSGNVANASAVATLPAPNAAQRWNITKVEIQASGSTTALPVNATLSGLDGGAGAAVTAAWSFLFPAGVLTIATPIIISYESCPLVGLPGTAVVLTLPAGGSGNTNATVNIHGFVQ